MPRKFPQKCDDIIVLMFFFLIFFANNLLAHSWMAPKDAAQKQNPIAMNQVSVNHGKEIFMQYCAYCHGDSAKGLDAKATGLKQNTPNLLWRLQNHTEGDFHWKIISGKDEMPSFKEDLSEKDIWSLINYLKTLKE